MTTADRVLRIQRKSPSELEEYLEHEFPATIGRKPESISWEENNTLVVGTYRQFGEYADYLHTCEAEFESLFKRLCSYQDNTVVRYPLAFPRNNFISFSDLTLVGMFEPLVSDASYVRGTDFVIVADSLRWRKEDRYSSEIFDIKGAIEKFWRALGIEKTYFVPAPLSMQREHPQWSETNVVDIDYYMASVPWLGLYTVTQELYEQQREMLKHIEREENIEFIPVEETRITIPKFRESILWANNFLAYKGNADRTTIKYNPLSVAKKTFPDRKDIYLRQSEPISITPIYGKGSIHCMTNTVPNYEMYKAVLQAENWVEEAHDGILSRTFHPPPTKQ